MRSRRSLLLAGVFGMVLVVGALALWLLHAPRVTDAAYERIDLGLTLMEVEAIIGGPPGNYGGEQPEQYLPRSVLAASPAFTVVLRADLDRGDNAVDVGGELNGLPLTASVTNGFMPVQSWAPSFRRVLTIEECKALRQPARRAVWTGRDYAIAVQLDAEDRVVNACLAKNFREPGPLERLLDRIGIR